MIKRKLTIVLVVDVVLYLFFVLSCFSQGELFAQDYYSPSMLTRTKWGLTTINVRKFYHYNNGTVVPASMVTVYPNYPFIIGAIFMITNMLAIANILNTITKANKTKAENVKRIEHYDD